MLTTLLDDFELWVKDHYVLFWLALCIISFILIIIVGLTPSKKDDEILLEIVDKLTSEDKEK